MQYELCSIIVLLNPYIEFLYKKETEKGIIDKITLFGTRWKIHGHDWLYRCYPELLGKEDVMKQ